MKLDFYQVKSNNDNTLVYDTINTYIIARKVGKIVSVQIRGDMPIGTYEKILPAKYWPNIIYYNCVYWSSDSFFRCICINTLGTVIIYGSANESTTCTYIVP